MNALWARFTDWLAWRERRYLRRRHVADLVAVLLLLGLIVGFFWRTISGDVFQPADGGDLVSFLYPTYRFAAAQLTQGILPLWNPTLYGGAPFISDIQAGFLYLPNLLLFWLWPDFDYSVMQWFAIGHLAWAALGMYIFLRAWSDATPLQRLSRSAALFGALAFALSDPLLIHLGNLNLIAVLSWLPWVLAAYHKALYHHSLRWAAIAGFLFAMANFAGHAQSTFYIGLVLALFTLSHWAQKLYEWRNVEQPKAITLPRVIATFQYPLITATLTILLSAPILLPAMELPRFTERDSFTYQDTVAYSLAPAQAIGMITPGFFGRGPALHWSLWSRVETPYAGVATLILAIGALSLATPTTRRRLWGWLLIGAVGVGTALGIYAILHGWLTWLLPIFGHFRAPARALVLWSFALAVLAAVGVDAVRRSLIDESEEKTDPPPGNAHLPHRGFIFFNSLLRWGAMGLLGIATPLLYLALLLTQEQESAFLRASVALLAVTTAAAFWLATWALVAMRRAGWLSSVAVAALLVALVFVDLSATGAYTDISPSTPTRGYEHAALIEFLQSEPRLGRIDSRTDIQDLWQPDSAALYGLEDVNGVANPLMLAHWHQLWEALGGRDSRLYDMLHITHLLVRDGTPLPEGKFEQRFTSSDGLTLYRNTTALERAWLVHDVTEVDTTADAFAQLTTDGFDPAQAAIIERTPGVANAIAAATGAEEVQIVERTVNSMVLESNATAPALLVLSEIWYPGWYAVVNGEATTIIRTNGALRGIVVPAGQSIVELHFRPDSWRAGLLAAVAGWLVLLIVFIFEKSPQDTAPLKASYTGTCNS